MTRGSSSRDSGALVVYSDRSGETRRVGAAAVAAPPPGGIAVRRACLGSLAKHTVFEGEPFGTILTLRIVTDIPGVVDVIIYLDNQSAIIRVYEPCRKSDHIFMLAIRTARA
ncbi:hypothetical protein AURDEDRAFT_173352 [Auricularia subglabra TFB-10046 SS5]|nr:hypothetical protein AURDEDRAFT_173352 [Auricularia subglabra TFB-10046 SS5]